MPVINKTTQSSVDIVASKTTLKKIVGQKEVTKLAQDANTPTTPTNLVGKIVKGPCS